MTEEKALQAAPAGARLVFSSTTNCIEVSNTEVRRHVILKMALSLPNLTYAMRKFGERYTPYELNLNRFLRSTKSAHTQNLSGPQLVTWNLSRLQKISMRAQGPSILTLEQKLNSFSLEESFLRFTSVNGIKYINNICPMLASITQFPCSSDQGATGETKGAQTLAEIPKFLSSLSKLMQLYICPDLCISLLVCLPPR